MLRLRGSPCLFSVILRVKNLLRRRKKLHRESRRFSVLRDSLLFIFRKILYLSINLIHIIFNFDVTIYHIVHIISFHIEHIER